MSDGWHTIETRMLLDAAPWVQVEAEQVLLEDGKTVVSDFYRVNLPDFVTILAVTRDQQVPVVRQYRHGPRKYTTELPSGILDEGETPLQSAQRELLEETGFIAETWHRLGTNLVDPNRGCGRGYFFLAMHAAQQTDPFPNELQNQWFSLIPLQTLYEQYAKGHYTMMSTVACLGMGAAYLTTNGLWAGSKA